VLDFKNRETLYGRIHRRVDRIVDVGLLQEAKTVLSGPYAPTALQAIGYKELRPYFDGEIALEEALDNLKKGTRHYAKRQMSWFRRIPYAHTVYVDDHKNIDDLADSVMAIWSQQ
jgi:tRNA dimethylallyltransferase